jgi:hypothetical protein
LRAAAAARPHVVAMSRATAARDGGMTSRLFLQDGGVAHHVRLRLPTTEASARALEQALFVERRWPACGPLLAEVLQDRV